MKAYRALALVFISSALVSAGLLFLSEPMIGKLLLPQFGGSPAVWNTCIVFFQVVLLAGYAYAHWSIAKLGLKWQPWVHVGVLLLPFLALPVALPAWGMVGTEEVPILRLLAVLTVMIGAPFFILATSGPLLQRWFAATTHPLASRPYFLYAASNFGSFVALLSYPFVVEPTFSLKTQQIVWSVGYGTFALLTLACVLGMKRMKKHDITTGSKAKQSSISWRQRGLWTFAAFVPSSLMLGVTTHLTTDVAAVPLLWVVPLALYLLTFVAAFGYGQPQQLASKVAPVAASGLFGSVLFMSLQLPMPRSVSAIFLLLTFTAIALIAHARLASSKPVSIHLTEFYLWVAIGGALGGFFNGLFSPVVFNNTYEFPIALLLALPLVLQVPRFKQLDLGKVLVALIPILLFVSIYMFSERLSYRQLHNSVEALLALGLVGAYLVFRYRPIAFGAAMVPLLTFPIIVTLLSPSLVTERTFYGVIKVQEGSSRRTMTHGLTEHGSQSVRHGYEQQPLSYYHQAGPIGDVIKTCQAHQNCQHVGVLGLGTGTLAAYGREGDRYTFYEIDPLVVRLANDPQYFTYLQKSKAKTEVHIGDGRLMLQKASDGAYDLLVLDAFTSDAIPTHLLTREALELYQRKLSANGLIAAHISNHELDLEPILQAGAKAQGLHTLVRDDANRAEEPGRYPSKWVVFAQHPEDLQSFQKLPEWRTLEGASLQPWTDDFSNIFDALIL